ncbi:MAG: DUF4129 domain-containing protein [Pseudomonadota bacterium]|nr:DUF4129 domain-containing protein [Pseudomonadota bacterium]
MRSRIRATWVAILLAWCGGTLAALALPSVAVAAPDETTILDALDEVGEDPNLSPERTIRTLRWLDAGDAPEQRETPGWLSWLGGLFQWIGSASRLLMWIGIVLLLGLLALFLKRIFGGYRNTSRPLAAAAPTHVRELDIRPASLPDDIGGAALKLWEGGDHRAALALLYRGLLSRLVHSHGVPIRESTTEADCLRLAVPRLHADAAEYATLLVRVWQHAVYGARQPAENDVRSLCSRFGRSFPVAARAAGDSP